MSERYKVRVTKDYLIFCSGHFITYDGDKCERLHGHNYEVFVEIEGTLNEDGLVFDFSILKRLTKEVCQRLDHRFLLPLYNPHIELISLPDSWEMRFQDKHYIFPRADVVELPIDNSSAERIAEYICNELCKKLNEYAIVHLRTILVGVEEAPMQMAYYQRDLHA